MKFRKKPVIVEAEQWFPQPEDTDELPQAGVFTQYCNWQAGGVAHYVTTVHGQKAFLESGDWVVREPDGVHYYPVKPDIFADTYEPVEEECG
ncbi:hypothetical protein LCGC14_1347050 [marine sediment metagenome]|uniref:Phage protein n=1 Tax=marine sediment metagenome TaxID=412755 RepID=A0A0F9KCK2_9ZZZZ